MWKAMRKPTGIHLTAWIALWIWAGAVPAASAEEAQPGLTVRVLDASGAPLADAKVCAGTLQFPGRDGIRSTRASGEARFPLVVPDPELRLRVAAPGHRGRALGLSGAGEPRASAVGPSYDVTLEAGEGGATCPPTETARLRVVVAGGAGATLCVGTTPNHDAFAARTLGADGVAVVEVPSTLPIRLIVDRRDARRIDDAFFVPAAGSERSYSLEPDTPSRVMVVENGRCAQRAPAEAAEEAGSSP